MKFIVLFRQQDTLRSCSNVNGLFAALGTSHVAQKWKILIESSKSSLKAILIHNAILSQLYELRMPHS